MNIRIKELFKSDLDPNSSEWWSRDKIDKINYNFNVLSNGGPAGPVGIEGPNGIDGIKGIEGPQGPQGPIGNQGVSGASSSGMWILETISGGSYNLPQRNVLYPTADLDLILNTNTNVAPTAIIGASAHPVDSNAGPALLSTFYNSTNFSHSSSSTATLTVVTQSPTAEASFGNYSPIDSILFMEKPKPGLSATDDWWHARSFVASLKASENISANDWDTNTLKIGVSDIGASISNAVPMGITWLDFKINQRANTIDLEAINDLGPNVNFKLSQNSEIEQGIKVIHNSGQGQSCSFTVGEIKYDVNANTNNVLVSSDTQGTVDWQGVAGIFNAMPVGSITKIPTSYFEDYFFTTTSTTSYIGEGSSFPLFESNFGAGQGMFQGWYLCNGQTWGDGGGISFDTPAASSFEYIVNDIGPNIPNTANNGNIMVGDNIIMAGLKESRVQLTSGYDEPEDSLISNNDLSNEAVYLEQSSSSPNHIERRKMGDQFTIIRLGNPDLKWGNFTSNVNLIPINASYHAIENSNDSNGIDIAARYAGTLAAVPLDWTGSQDGTGGTNDVIWNSDAASINSRFYQNGNELPDCWIVVATPGGNSSVAREYIHGTGVSSNKISTLENYSEAFIFDAAFQNTSGSEFTIFGGNIITSSLLNTATTNQITSQGYPCEEFFHSAPMNDSPYVNGVGSDSWNNYENSVTHIWQVNANNNTIIKPNEGWYRPVVESAEFIYSGITYPQQYWITHRKYWGGSGANEFVGETIKGMGARWSFDDFTIAAGGGAESTVCSGNQTHVLHFIEEEYPISSAEIQADNGSGHDQEINNITQGVTTQAPGGTNTRVIYVPANQSIASNAQSSTNRGKYPFKKVLDDTTLPMSGQSYPLIGDQSNSSKGWDEHYFGITDSKVNWSQGVTQCGGSFLPEAIYFESTNGDSAGIGDIPNRLSVSGNLINNSNSDKYVRIRIQDPNYYGWKIEWFFETLMPVLCAVAGADDSIYNSSTIPGGNNCMSPVSGSGDPEYVTISGQGKVPANTTSADNFSFYLSFDDSWDGAPNNQTNTNVDLNGSGVNIELMWSDTPMGSTNGVVMPWVI